MIRSQPALRCKKDDLAGTKNTIFLEFSSQLSHEDSNAPEMLYDMCTHPPDVRKVFSPLSPTSVHFTNCETKKAAIPLHSEAVARPVLSPRDSAFPPLPSALSAKLTTGP